MRTKEINNGRLAMIAMVGFAWQELRPAYPNQASCALRTAPAAFAFESLASTARGSGSLGRLGPARRAAELLRLRGALSSSPNLPLTAGNRGAGRQDHLADSNRQEHHPGQHGEYVP